jgi:hypothetical protein
MRALSILLAGVLLSACAGTADPGEPAAYQPAVIDRGTGVEVRVSETGSVAERTVEVSPAAAWRVLPRVYQALGLGGRVLDAGQRSFGNPLVSARTVGGTRVEALFRCANEGTGPSSVNRLQVRFSVSTTVSGEGEGEARIRTSIVATGRPLEGTSTGQLICISRGILEAAIEKEIAAAAGG